MSKEKKTKPIVAVNLTKQVYIEGGDFELLCCQVGSAMAANWVSAAEIVYEMTGNPGSVVRNTITFDTSPDEVVEIDLLNGHFDVRQAGSTRGAGRKGLELLMVWKGMTFEQALEWVRNTYSVDKARAMGLDYVNMKLAGTSGTNTP
ncbi:MAG: hypothetical protein E6Q76_10020 [Rhizobium sp.]|nr:MAG: hypothetical protein E6Q76_10020 [Rhizobium sp.]